jgi:hypothetical protein
LNEWSGKSKYFRQSCLCGALSAMDSKWLDAGSNPGRRSGEPATTCLSYGTACTQLMVIFVRFEVFTAVTMKNCVFWVVTPCGSCKNRRFGGT